MFILRKIEGGRMNVFEPQKLTVGASAVVSGQGLVLTNGLLVSAGAGKPTYIALADSTYTETDEFGNTITHTRAEIPVGRVEANHVYETTFSVAPTSLKVGAKVTLNGGLTVTATTDSGVAEIVDLCGASAAGDKVLVRFS